MARLVKGPSARTLKRPEKLEVGNVGISSNATVMLSIFVLYFVYGIYFVGTV
jgi:hypothetical protein